MSTGSGTTIRLHDGSGTMVDDENVEIVYVGTSLDLENFDGEETIFWDDNKSPEQQENANCTDWDSRWLNTWNHLYD